MRLAIKRMQTVSGTEHEFQPMADRSLRVWCGFDKYDAKHAPTFLKKDGSPRRGTSDGKWLEGLINASRQSFSDSCPVTAIGVTSCYFVGMYIYHIRVITHDGNYYVYNFPSDGNDMVDGSSSKLPDELVEISFSEWAKIVEDK
jgi:hypothetical protein